MDQPDNILDDFQEPEDKINPELYLASTGQRLANYLLDRLGFYILVFLITTVFDLFGNFTGLDTTALQTLAVILAFPGYWICFEYFLGKTPAKFVTRTRVVTDTGDIPDLGKIIGRSFCRLIPFEQFSFLGSRPVGWHDSISGTRVITDY